MKKKLLYIHHAYHNKTKSTLFLINLLKTQYEVEFFSFDPHYEKFSVDSLKNKKFDVLVLFQIMPSVQDISNFIEYEHGVFFPMFDGVPYREDPLWYEYRDFHIINFSRTLHEELTALGFDSHYFQYFPKPVDNFSFGDEKSIFFWQRISKINIDLLDKIVCLQELNHIHVHTAVDPGEIFLKPNNELAEKCSFSEWFERKEDLNELIENSALYFAPRLFEGIGLSFLEAMAMGRCVIAPDNPTMNEYIVHNETGFLYDFSEPQRIRLVNVREIQKNAYEYIKKGYQKWEKDKFKILDVIESPVNQKVNSNSFVKPLKFGNHTVPFISVLNYGYKKKYSLFNKILLFKISSNRNYRKYSLLGLFSLTVYDFGYKKKYCLFHKIPLFKVSFHQNYLKYSLFGLFPFTIYNFGYKKKYCLFHKIPLFKKLYLENTAKFYLFGFVLLFTVEKEL